jgi:hypothetical protein
VPDWLDGVDPSKAPHKLRREIERLDPDKGVPSKAALKWLIGTHLTEGRTGALIATINRFKVPVVVVRRPTELGLETLMAAVKACPSLRRLGLTKARISDDQAHEFASALAGSRHVSDLELNACELSPQAWKTVTDLLSAMHGLERLRIEARAGRWLPALGNGVAGSSSLTTLELSLSKLRSRPAAKLGETLRGNRSLTKLAVEVHGECDVVESFMETLVAPADGLEGNPLPRLAELSLVAHPLRWPEDAPEEEEWFGPAFGALLVRQIEARSELARVCIKPGIGVDGSGAGNLKEVIRKHLVEFDISLRKSRHPMIPIRLGKELKHHLALREYLNLVARSAALEAAAKALLCSIPVLGGSLPADPADQIVSLVMGGNSLRQRRARQGWMQVNKAAYEAAAAVRSKECVDALLKPHGKPRDDPSSTAGLMRLELSGIPLQDRDRGRLNEAFSSWMENKYHRWKGNAMVREHMKLAWHLLAHHNRDGALFALASLRRVAGDFDLEEPLGSGILRMRIALKR